MPIRLSCPRCSKKLKVDDERVGKRVICPGCEKGFQVPLPAPATRVPGATGHYDCSCPNCGSRWDLEQKSVGKAMVCGGCEQLIFPTPSRRRLTDKELASIRTTWKVSFPSFRGSFRVGRRRAVRLLNPATLLLSRTGSLSLETRYDPRGSCGYAVLASAGTAVLVWLLAQVLGFMAGPGFLVWYWLIRRLRRQYVSIAFDGGRSIVVDRETRRVALHTSFEGTFEGERDWIAFQMHDGFDEAVRHLSSLAGRRCVDGKIKRDSMIPAFVLLGIILVVFTWVGYYIVSGTP